MILRLLMTGQYKNKKNCHIFLLRWLRSQICTKVMVTVQAITAMTAHMISVPQAITFHEFGHMFLFYWSSLNNFICIFSFFTCQTA
jgi:hypothetical protein